MAWRERSITFAEQRRRRLRDFLPAVGVAYEESALDAVFEGYLRAYEDSWRAFDDVADALAELARLGLPTAVLTNGTTEQQNDKLRRTGLAGGSGRSGQSRIWAWPSRIRRRSGWPASAGDSRRPRC